MKTRYVAASLVILIPLALVPASKASDLDSVVDQLRSILPVEQQQGLVRFEANRGRLMTEAMGRLRDGAITESDIDSLLILLSPWQRGLARVHNHRGNMALGNTERPAGRPPFDFPERDEIVNLLLEFLSKPPPDASETEDEKMNEAFKRWTLFPKASVLLGELIGLKDFDRLVALLQSSNEPLLIDSVLPIFETWYALPNLYPSSGICGNSSEAEFKRFEASEVERTKRARQEVIEWHQKHRELDLESRLNAAIETYWEPRFAEYGFMSQSYFGGPPTWKKLESLIRQGEAALPFYQRRLSETEDLLLVGNYAVVISVITGKEDEDLVRKLLSSEELGRWEQYATFAMEIILAAHSTRWKADLVALQARPYFDGKRATEVLARCHLHEALPQLEAELKRNPKNYMAKYSIEELREWK